MLKKIKGKLSGNKKNIAKISSGTLLGQMVSFITLPIITRIYGAEVLGLWAIFHSYSMIVKSFSDLGLTHSIMVEDDENVEKTYKVVSTLAAVISVISAIILTLYFAFISKSNDLNIAFLFFFFAFIFFTTQQVQLCYTWLNRDGKYNVLMKNPIVNGVSYGFFAIILGLLGMKVYGYFVGYMIGQIITLIHMKRNLPKRMFTFNIQNYKETFSKNKRFIIYQTPTNLITNFKNQFPVFLIKAFWGTEILGYYSITVRLLQIPSTLLARAIGRVFFHTTAAMKREGKKLGVYVYKSLTRGMKIGIIPMILLMAFGDIGAVILLGPDWAIAGDFVRIMTLQYFFRFLTSSVQGLSITLNKQHYALVSSITQIVGFLIGAIVGKFVFDDIYVGLALMSIFYIVINIIYFCFILKVMSVSVIKYIRNVVASIFTIISASFAIRWLFDFFGVIDWILRVF